jgi:hypothetical protein
MQQLSPQDLQSATAFTEHVIPLYIESARTYSQLSIGAIALTVTFREKVLAQQGKMRIGPLLFASWSSFLAAIGASAWYQYVAVKLIEVISRDPAQFITEDIEFEFPLSVSLLWPGYAYGVMVTSFFLGAVLLVIASSEQLLTRRKSAA